MKKRSIFIVVAAIILFIITGCSYEKPLEMTDAIRFKGEYESINGDKVEGTDYTVRTLSIPEDNPFIYAEANDIISMMDYNETFVVYFGFNSCPWCRSVLPVLLDVSKNLNVEKIYYVDIKDIRDELDIDKDGNIITVKEGSEGYIGLLARFDNVLEDYLLEINGKEIATGKKRIYAPNVISVVNGKAMELETGISEEQDNPFMELSDNMKKETYKKFECSLKCVLENKNSCSSKHAC